MPMKSQAKTTKNWLLNGAAFSILAFTGMPLAQPAFAQSEGDASESTDGAEDARRFQTVTVTARKREESLTDIPVSISAVGATKLEEQGVTSISELFSIVPGVENNEDGSRIASKPAIRGVGAQQNVSIRAKVTSFLDGVPFVGAQGIGSFSGLQQVDVLRGPQSAAFGRSTFGGAINYVTRTPSDEFELNLRADIAEHDTLNFSGVMSVPISDFMRAMITLEERNYGGPDEWVTTSGDQLGERNDRLGSIKLDFGTSEKFRAKLFLMTQEVDDTPEPILFAPIEQLVPHPSDPDGMCIINGGMNSCVILGAIDSDAVPLVFDYDYDNAANPILDPGTRIQRDRVQGEVSTEFDNGLTLTLLGGYTEEEGDTWLDRDTFNSPGMLTLHVGSSPEATEKYGEARLSSPQDGSFDWLIGASVYDYDYSNTVFSNRSAGMVMGFFEEGATNVGIFFNLGYDLSETVTAAFEGRYQSDEITGQFPANPGRNAPDDISLNETTESFQPRFSLNWTATENQNLYLQIAKGTNPAGFNVVAVDPILNQTASDESFDLTTFVAFDEEEIWNYEVGSKGYLADGAINYSASLYYLQWKGYVQPSTADWTPDDGVLLPGTTGTDYFQRVFANIGDLDGFGAEIEGTWRVNDNLQVSGALAYTGTEFTEDSCSPVPLDYGVPAEQTSPFACTSLDGVTPPLVSKYTTSLNVNYTKPVTANLDGYARLSHSWRSKRYTEVTNTDYLDAFHTINLSAGVRTDNWFAELYAKNLFDDDTPSGAVRYFDSRTGGMFFNTSFQQRRPQQIGIRLGYDFN